MAEPSPALQGLPALPASDLAPDKEQQPGGCAEHLVHRTAAPAVSLISFPLLGSAARAWNKGSRQDDQIKVKFRITVPSFSPHTR